MSIFSRRRAPAVAATPSWQPESGDVIAAPACLMNDDGCASEQAYGARFLLESAPGAALTVWAYAVECGPDAPGCYFVGYRIEHEAAGADGCVTWSASLYAGDVLYAGNVPFAEWFDRPETAITAARESAADLIRAHPGMPRLHVPEDTVTEWFGWDGVPW